MTRRQRLVATFQGKPVDRPAVNFDEIGGPQFDPDNPDRFNICNDPSWRPRYTSWRRPWPAVTTAPAGAAPGDG